MVAQRLDGAQENRIDHEPITAIQFADTTLNPATVADPTWSPFLPTPAHPEYPANHATVAGAAAAVLAFHFGDDVAFSLVSEVLPGATREYPNFSAAADEANDAGVFGGIHFRSSVRDGRATGESVARFVLSTIAQPRRRPEQK